MKSYYRIMLGRQSSHASRCFQENFIGVDYGIKQDLTLKLPEEWRIFNKEFIPIYLAAQPHKSKVAAGLACGAIWTASKGIKKGDIAISPDGEGSYRAAEVTSDYYYIAGDILPHRRHVKWHDLKFERGGMSDALRNSTGSTGTVCNISQYSIEIEKLIVGSPAPAFIITDQTIEDPATFAMEKHLEEFLVQNWNQTDLGKEYDIYEEEGDCVGRQYQTDTGPIDILAISRNKKTILVVELKRGRASDSVVGQTLRYMGFVQEELAEEGQVVCGAIIALEDDPRTRRALAIIPNIDFYKYQVSFKLHKF
ncbi:MAG: DUF91 domain-containing protein [Planctomycetes bacterium]|nr:DUF91 domain-containing protein [Planctomycetota bacterium]